MSKQKRPLVFFETLLKIAHHATPAGASAPTRKRERTCERTCLHMRGHARAHPRMTREPAHLSPPLKGGR